MIKIIKNMIIYVLIIFINFSLYGINTIKITANESVKMALKSSLDFQNTEYKERIKDIYKSNAWNILFPDLSIGIGILRSESISPVSVYNSKEKDYWALNLNTDIKIVISPSILKNFELVRLDYESAKIDKKKAVDIIKLNTLKAYNQLIALKNSVEVYESQLENSKLKADQSNISYKNGLISELDYLDFKLKYNKHKSELENQRIVFENSKEVFKVLIGLPVDNQFEIVGDFAVEEVDMSLLENEIDILEFPKLKSLKNSLKMLETKKDLIWLDAFFPNFSLSYSYSFSKNFGYLREKFQNPKTGFLSFSLSYNISKLLPWSKSCIKIKEKEQEIKILLNQIEKEIQNRRLEIIQIKRDIQKYKSILKTSKLNVDLAKRTYKIAFDSFNSGTIDFLRLSDIELSLKNSELQFIKDKLEYSNSILSYRSFVDKLD